MRTRTHTGVNICVGRRLALDAFLIGMLSCFFGTGSLSGPQAHPFA